jgi:hypothetical protein
MSKLQADLTFGIWNETKMKPILEKFFNENLTKTFSKYDAHDFMNENKKKKFELKSRRIVHNQYPTAIVNASKIRKQDPNVFHTYVWNYTDGLYYLPYDKDIWKNFTIRPMRVERDGRVEIEDVIDVPHTYLRPISV